MATPGPVNPLQSPSFVHTTSASPLLPCILLQMSQNIDLTPTDKVLSETVALYCCHKEKVLTFTCAVARRYQYFISNCKFPADLLFLSFMNDINCRLKHHGREQCSCKQSDRFWTNLINAAPLMNTLVSFGNKLLRQLKYSWEPFRLWLL